MNIEIDNPLTVIIAQNTEKEYVPLDSNFNCVTIGDAIELTWNALNIGTPVSFQIERDGEIVKTLAGNVFTFTDADLENGNYTYNLLTTYQGYPYVVVQSGLRCKVKICD